MAHGEIVSEQQMPTMEEMEAYMEKQRAQKAADCTKEIEEILKAYNCAIVPVVVFHGDKIIPRVEVVPLQ